ncbi:protein vav isoform X1 [Cloeon dipterum]|uniref:protein vav isoform X1 n=1 Tax=Cloeon dipterum TaxID=197152 RepID=UPI0032206CF8
MAAGGGPQPELWHHCARWLTQCGLLRGDHKANWRDSEVGELAFTLRDGVILCSLLNVLDPGCIDLKQVNQKPQMAQFLCLRNIKTFLSVCKEAFHLEDQDLFEPEELFDLSNFFKVLQTLSKLSRCPKVQRKSVQGFDASLKYSDSHEDIYRSLNYSCPTVSSESSEGDGKDSKEDEVPSSVSTSTCSLPSSQSACSLPTWKSFPIACPVGDETAEEEAYEELCYITFNTKELSTSQALEKRDYVIKELVETEKNYIEVLQNLQNYFMRPLMSILPHRDHSIIFCNIKELTDVHMGFYTKLQDAVSDSVQCAVRIGKVFQYCQNQFLLYGEYCANLPVAQELLNELCTKSEPLTQNLERLQEEANQGKFKLRDILSVPMQRILKYQLLLDKLLQETGAHHDDAKCIERAKEAMIDVAMFINEVKRDADTLKIINDIERSISEWDMPADLKLKDYGRLIKDGELRIKDHRTSKMHPRYVFIFDQVMIMCKTKGDQYKFRDCIHLGDYKVEDGAARKVLQSGARWSFQWFLVPKRDQTGYTLYARTMDDRSKWMNAIRDAMDNIYPKGCTDMNHSFMMHTLDKPQQCILCRKYLKGSFFQGYKCEQCSLVVHKECIQLAGACGGPSNQAAPVLPPRPPPSPYPPPRVNNQFLNYTKVAYLIRFQPNAPQQVTGNGHYGDWDEYLWFAGEMSRDAATRALQEEPDGTYMLRVRPHRQVNEGETDYALSLKTDTKVKHMKVYQRPADNAHGIEYFLSDSRPFPSIEALIKCYEHTSLAESFQGLNATLELPFKRFLAVARYDYVPTRGTKDEENQIPLRAGALVTILSKDGNQRGWWRGKQGREVGYFPKDFIEELPPDQMGNIDLSFAANM